MTTLTELIETLSGLERVRRRTGALRSEAIGPLNYDQGSVAGNPTTRRLAERRGALAARGPRRPHAPPDRRRATCARRYQDPPRGHLFRRMSRGGELIAPVWIVASEVAHRGGRWGLQPTAAAAAIGAPPGGVTGGTVAERSSDLRAAPRSFRRRWRIIGAAVVGLALGVLYAHLVPPQLTSRPWCSSRTAAPRRWQWGYGGRHPGADRAQYAGPGEGGPRRAPRALRDRGYQARRCPAGHVAVAPIDASSPQAKDAQALSQAVAQAYVGDHRQRPQCHGRDRPGPADPTGALDHQVKALQTQIDATSARLSGEDRKSPVDVRDAQLMAQLRPSRPTSRSSWTASRVSWPPAALSAPPPPWRRSSSRPLRPRALTRCSDC